MLDIILQILPVLGIILLVMLCVVIVFLLLVLFFPVSYKIFGKKDTEAFSLSARVNWLFGLLRIRYAYPEPGRLTVKLLWIMLYDTGAAEHKEKATDNEEDISKKKAKDNTKDNTKDNAKGNTKDKSNDKIKNTTETISKKRSEDHSDITGQTASDNKERSQGSSEEHPGEDVQGSDRVSEKIEKIKFTICSTYDKIKKIWENITYYVFLLQEEETHLLLSYVIGRVRSILRNIRPRKLRANVLFGTGAPDTTGYVFSVYGIFSPVLGPGVTVTPDFERSVLEGDFYAAGTVTSIVLVWHFLKVIINKKLWGFIDKFKTVREPVDTFDTEIREEYIKNVL